MSRGYLAFRVALLLGAATTLATCAHTKPEEMSAEAHREEAARHEREAIDESAQYDPGARQMSSEWRTPFDGEDVAVVDNPTIGHLESAEAHRRHAEAHEHAAQTLEKLETTSCGNADHQTHASCPLLTPYVARLRENGRGVELMFKDDAPIDELVQRMQCHLAWSRTEGFPPEQLPSCPLYRRGAEVRRTGERTVEIGARDGKVAEEIRADSRRLFGAPR